MTVRPVFQVTTLMVLAAVLLSCAPARPAAPAVETGAGQPAAPAAPKRITAAIMSNAHTFYGKLNVPATGLPGLDAVEELVNAGLSNIASQGDLRPQLAEAVPTIENGLWVVHPDGRIIFHSFHVPVAERNWTGSNDSLYRNPDMDALLDRYLVTIPRGERMQLVNAILRKVSDELPILHLFYALEPTLISNRMLNVGARPSGSTQAWNAYEWDVK